MTRNDITLSDETESDVDDKPLALPDVAPHPEIVRLDRLATRAETPLKNGRIVWRRWGAGPPLVLLHGGSGSWTHWIRNVEPLSEHFSVWAPDLPGHGDSDPLDADEVKLRENEHSDFRVPLKPEWQPPPIPLPVLGRVMAGAIEQLFPDQTINLVGFSFGGMIAASIAAVIPRKIRQLVLAGAGGLVERDPKMKPLLTWRFETDPHRLIEIQRRNIELLMLHRPESVDDLALNVHILNTRHTQTRKPQRIPTTMATLQKTGLPVSGIWGRFDALSSWKIDEIRQRFREIDSTSQFHIVDNAGHWVIYEAAEEFNRTLLRMLGHEPLQQDATDRVTAT